MSFEQSSIDFLSNHFFSGYTLFNTIIYSIILIIVLFGIINLFKHYRINPINLIFPIIPFVLFGSSIRAFIDNGIFTFTWWLITPGIYFIVAGLAIFSIFIGLLFQKKKGFDYRYTVFIIGVIVAIIVGIIGFSKIHSLYLIAIFQMILIWIIFTLIFFVIGKFWKLFSLNSLNGKINLSIISAHLFDASSTFIAVDYYGYFEQHVIPNSIYNLSGTAISMFPLKIIVICSALYLIDRYIDDEFVAGTLKLAIFILGLAPGLRNFLTLAIGIGI